MAIKHQLPGVIQGEAYTYAQDAEVKYSTQEPDNDKIINSLDDRTATYQIHVNEKKTYRIDARVYHSGADQSFEIWLGDRKVASSEISADRGWVTLENIEVSFSEGTQWMTVKGGQPMFAINWIDVKAI